MSNTEHDILSDLQDEELDAVAAGVTDWHELSAAWRYAYSLIMTQIHDHNVISQFEVGNRATSTASNFGSGGTGSQINNNNTGNQTAPP